MESWIEIKATRGEMMTFFEDDDINYGHSVKWFERTKKGKYKVLLRHPELKARLSGTFTPDEIRTMFSAPKRLQDRRYKEDDGTGIGIYISGLSLDDFAKIADYWKGYKDRGYDACRDSACDAADEMINTCVIRIPDGTTRKQTVADIVSYIGSIEGELP